MVIKIKRKKNKGYISIEIIILMSIMFITGMLIMGKWIRPGQDAVKSEETAFSQVINQSLIKPGGSGGGGYVPVDPNPWPDQGGGQVTPKPTQKPDKPGTSDPQTQKITITFNTDGGNSIAPIEINSGESATLPTPVKTNYEFLGWFDNGVKVDNTTKFTKSVTLTAQWKGNTISYVVKHVSDSGKQIGTETITGTFGENKLITAPDKPGYNKPANLDVKFDSVSKEIEFKYTRIIYNITYDLKGGTANNPTTYTVEDTINLTAPSKNGYTFSGWTGSNGTSPQQSVAINAGSTGDKNYVANWAGNLVNYTVKYVSESGKELGTETLQGTFGESKVVTAPAKNGYVKPVDQTIVIDSNTKEVTFTYNLEHYTITYDLQGGTATNANTYTVEESVTLTAPTKSGFEFIGWTGANGTTPQKDVFIPIGNTGNKSYKANWQQLTYVLQTGPKVNTKLREIDAINQIKSIEFVDTVKPDTGVTEIIGLDLDNDGGVVGWYSIDTTDNMAKVYISTQKSGQKVVGNADCSEMFELIYTINLINVDNLDVSNVLNMNSMFYVTGRNTTSFEIKGLDNWNVSNVTNMMSMFDSAGQNATTWSIGDLSQWNVQSVTNMSEMFNMTARNANVWDIGNLDNWNTKSLSNAGNMFAGAGVKAVNWNIGNLNNWSVSNVTDMNSMFSAAGENATTFSIGDLSSWNVSNVKNMRTMFTSAGKNATTWSIGDLSQWNVSNVTDMSFMFSRAGYSATTWNIGQLNNWNVNNVTNMSFMFSSAGQNATTWNIGDLSNWNTANVTNMQSMFFSAGQNATTWSIGDLSQWNVSNVTNMMDMFANAGQNSAPFTLDLSGWDASNITDIREIFYKVGANKIMLPKNIPSTVKYQKVNPWEYEAISKPWYDITDNNKEYLPGTFPVGNGNVSHTLVDTKPLTYTLVNGPTFNTKLREIDAVNQIKLIEFVDTVKPDTGVTEITGLDLDNDGGIVGWYSIDTTDNMAKVYVSTQKIGQKVIANADCSNMFYELKNTEYVNVNNLDTIAVNSMTYMFKNIGYFRNSILVEGLDSWDVSNVVNMSYMFSSTYDEHKKIFPNYESFILKDISNWNTSKVIDMSGMFAATTTGMTGGTIKGNNIIWDIGNLSQWDVGNVIYMNNMFKVAGYATTNWNIGDLSQWNVSKVTNMSDMFHSAGMKANSWNIGDIGKWNVSNVTNMSSMFSYAGQNTTDWFIGDLSQWNVSNVTDMSWMFDYAGRDSRIWSIGNLSQWNVSKVVNMSGMFMSVGRNTTTWNIGDLSQWDVSKVKSMSYMFESAGLRATNWNIGNLSQWDVSNVTNMSGMFRSAGQNATNWNIGQLNNWNVSKVTDMGWMFQFAGKSSNEFNVGDLNDWHVNNVTNMQGMFCNAGQNATIWNIGDLSRWDVSKVTNMKETFRNTGIKATTWNIGDVKNWNVSNVTDMSDMFNYAGRNSTPFTLDISGWDVSNVTDIVGMFHEIGANKIMLPKNIASTVKYKKVNSWEYETISKPWYDITDNYKEYLPGTFPIGNGPVSHTLVDTKPITYVLQTGPNVNAKLREIDAINKIKSIEFVDTVKPDTGVTEITGLDLDNDGGVVGWYSIDTADNMAKVYVSTQKAGQKVIANTDCSYMFGDYYYGRFRGPNIKLINVSNLDVSKTTNMIGMFYDVGCDVKDKVDIIGLDSWNVSNVTNMGIMFSSAGKNATNWSIGDLSQWNVSNVTNMSSMFSNAGLRSTNWSIGDLSQWDVSNVIHMSGMFRSAGQDATNWFIGDLSQWNVSNVTNMDSMFSAVGQNATTWSIGDLSQWNVSKVTTMNHMFSAAGTNATTWSIGKLTNWNVSNVTDMSYMLWRAGQDADIWDIGYLNDWDVSNVKTMSGMFGNSGSSSTVWDVGDLSQWNVGNVTDMSSMFINDEGYTKSKIQVWNVGDLSQWNTANVTDMSDMFAYINADEWNIGNISNWNVSNVTNMKGMFFWTGRRAKTKFTLDLSNWDASKVTDIRSMFYCVGANKIMTPKNISPYVQLTGTGSIYYPITDRTWYDITDNNKKYLPDTFLVGNGPVSHTLVDTKPI